MAIIISKKGSSIAEIVDKSAFEKEHNIQEYIHEHPESIPVYDIQEDKRLFVAAREFSTESGPIDAIAVDKDGDIYVVETKLYRNPDKRTVVAQALDYGASLWKHMDESGFIESLDRAAQVKWKMDFGTKVQQFFSLDNDQMDALLETMKRNLREGNLKFVILMDTMDDRLKDLITYVNEKSKFDIFAVQLEYYKHAEYEIVIPKLFGAEVKKDIPTHTTGSKRLWNWDLFKQRLSEFGEEEVVAAQHVIDWAGENNIAIEWTTSQRGGFFPTFYNAEGKWFCPFGVTGDATISWNAPHAADKSPSPFDKKEKRAEILKRLESINGATVDLENVDGYNGLKLPLRAIANKDARREFFAVCSWIKDALETKA